MYVLFIVWECCQLNDRAREGKPAAGVLKCEACRHWHLLVVMLNSRFNCFRVNSANILLKGDWDLLVQELRNLREWHSAIRIKFLHFSCLRRKLLRKGHVTKWLYTIMRRYWCNTNWGKDNWKLVKMVWIPTKKATESTNEENRLHGFLSFEKGREGD